MSIYDFANILFAGPCNQRCPYCIGRQLDPALNRDNLSIFPLLSLERFVGLLKQHHISQITLTGTNTDPQLYSYEANLVNRLHESIPGVQISLHTNGQLALVKMDTFNLYDRATISFPSFDPQTFASMTGVRHMPDLDAILQRACIPVKVSCVLGWENTSQVRSYLTRCHRLGVKRLVFRQQFTSSLLDQPAPIPWRPPSSLKRVGIYRNNPVYDYAGMQVTYWHFDHTTSTALNLFADGSITTEYLLARHPASSTNLLTKKRPLLLCEGY